MSKSLTAQLRLTLLDQVSGPARQVNAALNRMQEAAKTNAQRMEAMRGKMFDAVAVGYTLARAISAPVRAAVAFESAMADIKKVVDFPTPQAFKDLGIDIRAMAREMPMAATGIAELVAAAGQSGIALQDLTKFSEMAVKVAVAWDMTGRETGEALAKIKTALALSIPETQLLADAINHLGNNSAAAAKDILEVVKRVGPMGQQFGMAAKEVAALGAAMVGSGFEPEVAATSIMNMGRALTKGASATKAQRTAFKQLGLEANQVSKSMQANAMGTIQDILNRIAEMPAHMRASLATNLFGSEARAMGPLISNAKLLADTLKLVGDQTKYAGSAQREYNERSGTTGKAMQTFRNKITDLSISIGDALLPGLNQLLSIVGPIVTGVSNLATQFPNLTSAIVATTAAVVALRVAAIALAFVGLFTKGAFLGVAIKGMKGLALATAGATRAFTALRGAAVGAAMLSAVGGGGAITGLVAAIVGMSAPIWATIGAVIGAVSALAFAIYKYWTPISEFVSGFVSGITTAFEPVINYFSELGSRIVSALGLEGVLATFKSTLASIGTWLGEFFSVKEYTDQAKADFRSMGEQVAATLVSTVTGAINAVVNAVAALPGQIVAILQQAAEAIYNAMVGPFKRAAAYISSIGSSIKSWVPGMGGGAAAAPPVDGKRATGGPVRAGGTYLVGERGPELVTPQRSGYVNPNSLFGNSSQGVSRNMRMGDLKVSVYMQGSSHSAEQVGEAVGRRVRNELEAAFADSVV